MDKKRIQIIAGVAALVLISVTVYFLAFSGGQKNQQVLKAENWDAPFPTSKEMIDEVFAMFEEEDMPPTFDAFLKGLESGEINFVWKIWELRRQCPPDMDRYQCNSRIIAYLQRKYPGSGGERLAGLLKRYLNFEEIMSATRMADDLTMRQRYDIMRKKRGEVFHADEEALVFGMEEAKMDLADRSAAFIKDTAGKSGEERVKAYEEMRKKTMGPYYDAFIKDEPSFDRYETELVLRDTDFGKATPQEQQAMTNAIRVRYFGEAGAARMAAVEKDLAAADENIKKYEDAEAKFLKDNASLSAADREAGLKKLRIQYMGPEEAEAYTRRRQYEESMKALNITP